MAGKAVNGQEPWPDGHNIGRRAKPDVCDARSRVFCYICKRMNRFLFVLIAATALVLTACENREAQFILTQAEARLEERPLEVRLWLEGADSSLFNTRRLRAERALIYAMALDKNWCDTTDVGVIQPAVDYYTHHGPLERRAKTWYYLGRIQDNRGDNDEAMSSFMKARRYAETLDDDRFKSLICSAFSFLFSKSNDYEEALAWADSSYRYSLLADDPYLANSSRHKMALNYSNLEQYEQADSLYRLLLEDTLHIYKRVYPNILNNYAISKANQGCFEEACLLYENALARTGTLLNTNHWGAYAFSLSQTGRQKRADSIFRQLEQGGKASFFSYLVWKSRAEALDQNYEEAFSLLEQSTHKQEENLRKVLQQTVLKTQRDLYEQDVRQEKREKQAYRIILLLICALFILGVLTLLVFLRRKRESARQREESLLEATRDLMSQVDDLQHERATLQAHYAHLQQKHFRELGDLFKATAGENAHNVVAKQATLYEKVKQVWKTIASDSEDNMLFEQQINERFDNVMEHLRKELPGHGPDYYRFASFVFAGFDKDLLMALTGTRSRDSVYSRKKRLRQDITASEAPHKEQFLQLLA